MRGGWGQEQRSGRHWMTQRLAGLGVVFPSVFSGQQVEVHDLGGWRGPPP